MRDHQGQMRDHQGHVFILCFMGCGLSMKEEKVLADVHKMLPLLAGS